MSLWTGKDSTTDHRKPASSINRLRSTMSLLSQIFPRRNKIEGSHDPRRARLQNLFERHCVLGSEPTPSFFHCVGSLTA